ncbi:hypothetical protein I7I48_09561 [Histoplasma ohiense]|nr:hypothetical protein I7I48_09561 [Histoplasma ohiense (nom. inval.)]
MFHVIHFFYEFGYTLIYVLMSPSSILLNWNTISLAEYSPTCFFGYVFLLSVMGGFFTLCLSCCSDANICFTLFCHLPFHLLTSAYIIESTIMYPITPNLLYYLFPFSLLVSILESIRITSCFPSMYLYEKLSYLE